MNSPFPHWVKHPLPPVFAILRDLSRFFAIPRYEDHEPHEPSRPTLFIHFVLLTSFLPSPSRLSGKRRDNKTLDDIGTSQQKSTTSQHDKNTVQILRNRSYDVAIHLIRKLQRAVARRASAHSRAPAELLRHPLQPELQHDLLSLQLKNTFLQVPDHILESLDDYSVAVHTVSHMT